MADQMAFQLATSLRYAVCEGRGIFLDLLTERYFALSDQTDAAVQAILSGSTDLAAGRSDIAGLVRRGILVEHGDTEPASGLLAPARELEADGAAAAMLVVQLLAARYRTRRDLHGGLLTAIATAFPDTQDIEPLTAIDFVKSLAASERLMNYVMPSHDQCLSHSLAFVRVCRFHGIAAQLVLGVIARPFCAHAWAQCGEYVLNDSIELVSRYAPIAAWP